jgi:hypothetical protein
MNFDFYIFGTPQKFELYPPKTQKIKYFKSFNESSKENSKMVIQRLKNGQVFYSYIRYNLVSYNGKSGAFFGISISFKDKYSTTDTVKLYQLLDTVYNDILQRGILLKKIKDQTLFTVSSLKQAVDSEIKGIIENNIRKGITEKFTDNDFKKIDNNSKQVKNRPATPKILSIDKGNEEILKVLKRCDKIFVSSEYRELQIVEDNIVLQQPPTPNKKEDELHLLPIENEKEKKKIRSNFFENIKKGIDSKELKWILCFLFAAVVSVIFSVYLHNVACLFLGALFCGFCVAATYKSIKNSNWECGNGYLTCIIGIIAAIVLQHASEEPFTTRFNRFCYNKENVNSFDQLIKTSETLKSSQTKKQKFIFAFDNSGGTRLTKKIATTEIITIHKQYLNDIGNFIGEKLPIEDCNYKNLLIARFCWDLINLVESDKYDLFVLKVGDPNKYLLCLQGLQESELQSTKLNIEDFIEKLYISNETKKVEEKTNFLTFYEKLVEIIGTDTCTLFIYSDFIHDLGNSEDLKTTIPQIDVNQKKLDKKRITQNLFYVPISSINSSVEKHVLPTETEQIKHFNISDVDKTTKISREIRKIHDNLPFYYSNNPPNRVSNSLQLNFDKAGNFICFKTDGDGFVIYDGIKEHDNCDKPLKSNEIKIEYTSDEAPKNPEIQVIQDGVTYIVPLKPYPDFNKWFILFCLFLTFVVGFMIVRSSKQNKTIQSQDSQ